MATKFLIQFWSRRFGRWMDVDGTPHTQEADANTIAARYRARQRALNGMAAERYRVDAVEATEG